MSEYKKVPLPDEWICTEIVARRTKTSVSTWERHRCYRTGCPYARIGRKVMYNWRVVVAWMEKNGGGQA